MDVFEAIGTARSMRWLRPDPIPVEDLHLILEAAVKAPNGGNQQRGRFLVVFPNLLDLVPADGVVVDIQGDRRAHGFVPPPEIVATITHERPHGETAYEIFYPDGPFALLPMRADAEGRHRSALVWSVKARDAAGMLGLPERALAHEIAKRMGGFLGEVELAGPRWHYPLGFHHCARITGELSKYTCNGSPMCSAVAGQRVTKVL